MRRLCLFLLVAFCRTLPGQAPVDSLRVTASFQRTPLLIAIDYLEGNHGLQFSFPREEVEAITVDCSFLGADWAAVEQCLFGAHDFAATGYADGYVSLRPLAPGGNRNWRVILRVRDEGGAALPFATISASQRNTGLTNNSPPPAQTTNEKGDFNGLLSCRRSDAVTISYIGHKEKSIPLLGLLDGRPQTIVLSENTTQLGVIRVREYLATGFDSGDRKIMVTPSRVPPVPGFAVPEILRTVSLLPGVVGLNESAADLSIRGGGRNQNLVLWDGIPFYGNGYFFGMVSPFSAEITSRVDVYRSQAEAGWGGRVAGVIDLRTDDHVTQTLEGGVGISLLEARAHLKAPLLEDKSDVQIAGRASPGILLGGPVYQSYRQQVFQADAFDNVLNLGDNARRTESNTFNFGEYSGRFRHDFGKGRALKISGIYAADRFIYASRNGSSSLLYVDEANSKTQGAGISYDHSVGIGRISVGIAQSTLITEGFSSLQGRNTELETSRKSGIRERSARLEFLTGRQGFGEVKLGVQAQEYDNLLTLEYENSRTDSSRNYRAATAPAVALATYGQYNRAISERLEGRFGFRAQQYGPTDKIYPEPKVGLGYDIDKSWRAHLDFAVSHQFPQEVINLDPQRISALPTYWSLADGNRLPVAAGREWSAGMIGQPRTWLLDLQVYHRRVTGITSLNTVFQQDGVDRGDARSLGADLLIGRKWPGLRAWGIYSLGRSEWRFPEMGADYFPADNDRRHRMRLMTSYRSKGWSVVGGWSWQSGAPYTKIEAVTTRYRPGGGRLYARPVSSPPNADRLPVYHRLDITASYDWRARNGGWSYSITCSLLNAYGRENTLQRTYLINAPDEARPRILSAEAIDRVGLGTTVNLGLKISFSPPADPSTQLD